jgi:S-DNA-T family DNA segregation ATPase FtsK/SpoIIIE
MPINGSNAVFGGQPGQGKSNAVRVAVAGVALDPLTEIRIHVFAKNGDFDAYQPRLALHEKGVTVEHVELAVQHLHDLYDEVGRREGRLAELGAKKLTRAISVQHRTCGQCWSGSRNATNCSRTASTAN